MNFPPICPDVVTGKELDAVDTGEDTPLDAKEENIFHGEVSGVMCEARDGGKRFSIMGWFEFEFPTNF